MTAEDVRIVRAGPGYDLELDEVFATAQADLWSAVTEPARLRRWMAEYRGDLQLGGTWQAIADGEVWGSGTVKECHTPDGFTTTWHVDGEPDSEVEVRLEPAEGGTRLRLAHRGLVVDTYGAGWAAYAEMLGSHLADPIRDDLSEIGFPTRYQRLSPTFRQRIGAVLAE